jgi:hypothetical protein
MPSQKPLRKKLVSARVFQGPLTGINAVNGHLTSKETSDHLARKVGVKWTTQLRSGWSVCAAGKR